ncbi:hypothetical protein [Methylovulum psychrotolerans]|uniref:Uncharacterized protein n=1 Tax=Methylovulum psychrotolerans TaxID=1704499 RepID=A0A2S5CT08_9GAMM|nr:hypothetical protein [Methylovulum psychrotolerans]POZ53953.1 hypothetical protein AADEFJLK_00995 [Methylovulum psychrotolerans]
MSVSHFSIAPIGFDELEIRYFTAVLYLAETRLHQRWQVVNTGDADFFVLPAQHPQDGLPPERCFIYAAEALSDKHIVVDASGIPSVSSLVAVLARAEGTTLLERPQALPPVADPVTPSVKEPEPLPERLSGDDKVFYPEDGLLKALLDDSPEPIWIVVDKTIDIWLDPVQSLYYSQANLEELMPYCTADSRILINTMTASELQRLVEKRQIAAKPLNNLIWYVAFKSSQGRLLAGNSPDDIVHLKGWPNLRLPEGRDFIKLAAFMHNNTLALADIAEATRLPLPKIYNFYNACYLVGLIEKSAVAQRNEKPLDADRRNLLDRIRTRLK